MKNISHFPTGWIICTACAISLRDKPVVLLCCHGGQRQITEQNSKTASRYKNRMCSPLFGIWNLGLKSFWLLSLHLKTIQYSYTYYVSGCGDQCSESQESTSWICSWIGCSFIGRWLSLRAN